MDWYNDISIESDYETMVRMRCPRVNAKVKAMTYRIRSANSMKAQCAATAALQGNCPVSGAENDEGEFIPRPDTDLDLHDVTDEFDFDNDDYDDGTKHKLSRYSSKSQETYHHVCSLMSVTPAMYFSNHLLTDSIVMRHHYLGPAGARACALALSENAQVVVLDLAGNNIGAVGARYFADMLDENFCIKELRLADNNLGSTGAKCISEALLMNTSVKLLDLSENSFSESDADCFRRLLLTNTVIRQLELSHNCFRERGGVVFGDIIEKNKTLTFLDLSWNHLRRSGAAAVGKGLASNKTLNYLNVSWNGFYLEGCKAMGKALERNRSLTDLNLQSNRINKECLDELMKGMKKNTTLTRLKLSDNPITSDGTMVLLAALGEAPRMALTEVDLGDQCVEMPFLEQFHQIKLQITRSLAIKHGLVLKEHLETTSKPCEEDLLSEDPILILMEFTKLKNLRLIDLFQTLDVDGSHSLGKNEIKAGLLRAGMPLSDRSLTRLLSKLDKDKSGDIDFGELMVGQKNYRRKMKAISEVAKDKAVAKKETEVQRVRIKLKELIAKHDQLIMQKILAKKGNTGSSRTIMRPQRSTELSMLPVPV